MVARGVATGVYIYIPPKKKISPSKFLWSKNDVRTAIRQFYTPKNFYTPENKSLATPLMVAAVSVESVTEGTNACPLSRSGETLRSKQYNSVDTYKLRTYGTANRSMYHGSGVCRTLKRGVERCQ